MRTVRKLPLKDAWVIFFVLGVVMLNYPFLHIFNKEVAFFGIPLTVLYFYIGWPVSIFIVYLFSIYLGRHSEEDSSENNQKNNSQGGAS